MKRILFLYAFYQKDVSYLQNLLYFIEHGINSKNHNNTNNTNDPGNGIQVDYIIIINGTMALDLAKMMDNTNVKIIFRENKDFDFGAYIHALDSVRQDTTKTMYWGKLPEEYDYTFYMNASVRGPFLPVYYSGHFLQPFIDLFASAKDVHLVGTTINVLDAKSVHNSNEAHMFWQITNGAKPPYTHVQSMFFGMDKQCFGMLSEKGFFNMKKEEQTEKANFVKFIAEREIMMSHLVLRDAKWNIGSIVREYRGQDYRTINTDWNPTSITGDPCFQGACYGRTLHPYEVVFIKTNRNISSDAIHSLSQKRK